MGEAPATAERPLLLVCDMDRTLIPNGPQAEPAGAREQLHTLVRPDLVTFAIATGRDRDRVHAALTEWALPTPRYVIADVGATVYRVDGSSWTVDDGWQRILRGEWTGMTGPVLLERMGPISHATPQEADRMGEFKASLYVQRDHQAAVTRQVQRRLDALGLSARLIYSVDTERDIGLLDILPSKASKLGGLRIVQQRVGVSDADTVFAGDSGNDIQVLTSGVPSVLVANAEADVAHQAAALARANGATQSLFVAAEHDPQAYYAQGVLTGVHHFRPDRWSAS